jgi:hypothetical protein
VAGSGYLWRTGGWGRVRGGRAPSGTRKNYNDPGHAHELTFSCYKRFAFLQSERLFWQSGGGYDRNIISGKTLLQMIDYLHLNPVRKSLVPKAADWKWSSAAWWEGVTQGAPLRLIRFPMRLMG